MALQPTLKVTAQELTYRAKHYHDIRVVKDRQLMCTSCGNRITIEAANFRVHPVMGSLQCEKCWDHYANVDFTSNEEGNDTLCRICGYSTGLRECNTPSCRFAFCRKCIKRNVNLALLDVDTKKWKCFLCVPKPFWEARAICAAAMDTVPKKNKKKVKSSSGPKWSENTCSSHTKQQAQTNALKKNLKTLCVDDDDSSSTDITPIFESKTSAKDVSSKTKKNTSQKRGFRKLYTMRSEQSSSEDEIIVEKEIPIRSKIRRKLKTSESKDDDSSPDDSVSKVSKQLLKCREADKQTRISPAKILKQRVSNGSSRESSSGKEFQPSKLASRGSVWKRMRKKGINEPIEEENISVKVCDEEECVVSKEEALNVKTHVIEILDEIQNTFESHVNRIKEKFNKYEITNSSDANRVITKCTDILEKFRGVIRKKETSIKTFYTSWNESYRKTVSPKKSRKDDKDNSIGCNKDVAKDKDKPSRTNVDESKEKSVVQVSDCDVDEIFSENESEAPEKLHSKIAEESRIVEKVVTAANKDSQSVHISHSTPQDCDDENHMDLEAISCTSPVLGSSKENKLKGSVEILQDIPSEKEAANVDVNDSVSIAESESTIIHSSSDSAKSDNATREQGSPKQQTKDSNDSLIDIFESSSTSKNASNECAPMVEEVDTAKNEVNTCELEDIDKDCELNESNTESKASVEVKELQSDTHAELILEENSEEEGKSVSEKSELNSTEVEGTADPPEGNPEQPVSHVPKDNSTIEDASEPCGNNTKSISEESANIAPPKELTGLKSPTGKSAQSESSSDVDTSCSTIIMPNNAPLDAVSTVKETSEAVNTVDVTPADEKKTSDEKEVHDDEEAAKDALLNSNSDDCTQLDLQSDMEVSAEQRDTSDDWPFKKIQRNRLVLLSSSSGSFSSDVESGKLNLQLHSTTPASDRLTRSDLKRAPEVESDKSVGSRVKRRRLRLDKNIYYMNDEKLRMRSYVVLKKIKPRILRKFARALKKSRQYQESIAFKSLINLDDLERKRRKSCITSESSNSIDDNAVSSKSGKDSKNKKGSKSAMTEETLMDHLKRVENGENLECIEENSGGDGVTPVITKQTDVLTNDDLVSEADRVAKDMLLNSDSDIEQDSDIEECTTHKDQQSKKTNSDKKKSSNARKSDDIDDDTDDDNDQEKLDKSNWKHDKLLTMKFTDSDSNAEQEKWSQLQKNRKERENKEEENSDSVGEGIKRKIKRNTKRRRRVLGSDSDIKTTGSDSSSASFADAKEGRTDAKDSEKKKKTKSRKKRGAHGSSNSDSSIEEIKIKPKRKRIKTMDSDSDNDSEPVTNSQGTPGKGSGRKNIRKVLKDKQVAEDTKQAAKEEEERLKRIAERQRVYNEMYELRLAGEEKVDKLVLDFDPETKEAIITAHDSLVKPLKPHQARGIKFMWDACFESLERMKTSTGSGCILAHCMGLGKTLQVITLAHTLLTHKETQINTIMVVCPLSTVLNWVNEFSTWLKDTEDEIEVYELTKAKKNCDRKYQLERWKETGGVLIIGYEMFRNLAGPCKNMRKVMKAAIMECLIDPGPDLVVCDEGHLLKNEETTLSKTMKQVKTLRRIVLTGTPLQNNLIEYHCMVQFVKPKLLGTKKEFLNRFVNPITNGQFDDSTEYDVKLMKKRAHVLHKMLEGSVQRYDYSVLTPFLPPKQEYVIFVRLTDVQIKMYQFYLSNLARRHTGVGGSLFADFQALQRIWTHPIVLKLNAEKMEKANEKRRLSSESEGSLKDFINDDSTSNSESDSSVDSKKDSDIQSLHDSNDENSAAKYRSKGNTTAVDAEVEPQKKEEEDWWLQFVQTEHFHDIRTSSKLVLLFEILKESEEIGDKVLVFSQSLYSLTLIEEFLSHMDDSTQSGTSLENLGGHAGSWSLGLDYFRLDGQTSAENRCRWCKIFNRPTNTRARLFLISTRAGGLGINLTAANRVIIFDASWNPSHDVQSIFRIYRFGQKKPCYVYRFLAAGTMEEKIYNRQVTKLSLSCRVVDEQQIERHYSNNDLNELYKFEAYNDDVRLTLNVPKDRLLAEIFSKHKNVVESYHEHDSLLENKAEEELDEEERKQAWLEYEEEKKGRPAQHPMIAYQNNIQMQQYNMMRNMDQANMLPQAALMQDYENLQQLIRKDYPNATPEQQKKITTRALLEMYQYWDKQVMYKPMRPSIMAQPRMMLGNTSTMNAFQQQQHQQQQQQQQHQQQQQQQQNSEVAQLLRHLQQKPGEPSNYAAQNVNKNVPYTITSANSTVYRNVPTTSTSVTDNDVVEVHSNTTSTTANATIQPVTIQPVVQPANKGQEE